jgi:hypothetical protein
LFAGIWAKALFVTIRIYTAGPFNVASRGGADQFMFKFR